jgi:hypothetical protein
MKPKLGLEMRPADTQARPLGGDQCRAEVRWERRNFSNRRPQAGADGEEATADGNARAAGRAARVGTPYNGNAAAVGRAENILFACVSYLRIIHMTNLEASVGVLPLGARKS